MAPVAAAVAKGLAEEKNGNFAKTFGVSIGSPVEAITSI